MPNAFDPQKPDITPEQEEALRLYGEVPSNLPPLLTPQRGFAEAAQRALTPAGVGQFLRQAWEDTPREVKEFVDFLGTPGMPTAPAAGAAKITAKSALAAGQEIEKALPLVAGMFVGPQARGFEKMIGKFSTSETVAFALKYPTRFSRSSHSKSGLHAERKANGSPNLEPLSKK